MSRQAGQPYNMRRYTYPEDEQYYVDIPDRWLGMHYFAYIDAVEVTQANEKARGIVQKFILSIAICDNYHLPGLTGKPEQWDYAQVDLTLMAWVSKVVYNDFMTCFEVPKKKPLASGDIFLDKILMDMQPTSLETVST